MTSNLIIAVALGAVFIVLVLGLFNMMRGGSASRSQNLMRWRVGLQFAAILIVLAIVWLRSKS
ncbi:twin transmembrane helix small protein [Aestuariivirga litoralis]|uniref:twin transmembrane helix small protein n=1 Tax=Aestuariivirga litoralis TaxID=2650924 RepID=UPI0018C69EC6|nr:twin transmembrane helix small protein [Aestuariivirga litoralis]MBG1233527.1 twin transmembrane helix small protein [Aestuariivirga litoralis]